MAFYRRNFIIFYHVFLIDLGRKSDSLMHEIFMEVYLPIVPRRLVRSPYYMPPKFNENRILE